MNFIRQKRSLKISRLSFDVHIFLLLHERRKKKKKNERGEEKKERKTYTHTQLLTVMFSIEEKETSPGFFSLPLSLSLSLISKYFK